ncbi:MAG: hypothetical protein N3E49_09170 [Bacteroidia bacterium]|nr:hypothetical protein [Bacteroidia bacterium]
MKSWLLRLLGTTGLLVIGTAQEVDDRIIQLRRPVIKFFPLPMIDPFQYTLHLGLEVPTSRQNSIQVEGGWVFGHLGDDIGVGTRAEEFQQTGFKARFQWREYFVSDKPPERPTYTLTGGYIGLLGGYQYYHQNLGYIDTSGIYPPSSNPLAVGTLYERSIQAFVGGFLLGYQAQLGSRIAFDLYTGLAIRYTIHKWNPLAPPNSYRFTPVGDFILRRGGRPIFLMGFSVGWILR